MPLNRTSAEVAVVVDDGRDGLAQAVGAALQRHGISVRAIQSGELALIPLDLDGRGAAVGARRVGALLFRARPHADFAAGVSEEDAGAEARAAWLGVMALPTVAVVNRLGADTWFSFSEWPVWRRRMVAGGVAVAELASGGAERDEPGNWLPWGGGVVTIPPPLARSAFGAVVVGARELRHSLWCYGSVVAGPSTPSVRAAGHVLAATGVNLAEIVTREDGRFVACTAHPVVAADAVPAAAGRITGELLAHLHRR